MKSFSKKVAETAGLVCVLPLLALYKLGIFAFATVSHLLSMIPGLAGIYIRRAWYSHTLAACGENLVVDFGGFIRTNKARVGNNSYVGVHSGIAQAEIGDDVLISGGVWVLSGGQQHGKKAGIRIREQDGAVKTIKIGNDVWIGVGAIVFDDIPAGCIVGAGSVVTKSPNENEIVAGAPARKIGEREQAD